MARRKTELKTFNRGLVSRLGLARTDLERTGISAETMTNWMPRNLGSMMLRPGTAYIGNTDSNNQAKYIPFIYAVDDTALIEATDGKVRVWVDDSLVTRPSVSTTVTNGDMSSTTGWTDNDESGAISNTTLINTVDYIYFTGDGTNAAIRTQEVTVSAADQNTEHALDIVIDSPSDQEADSGTSPGGSAITLKVGSTNGDDDYIAETQLDPGYHSLAFTPTGNFWIQLSNRAISTAYVANCQVESSGVMEITAPWAEADLGLIRYDQSGDIIYVACGKTTDSIGYPQYKIERRSSTSWSVALYESPDGPYGEINTSEITLTPGVITGTGGLTASKALFKSTDKGRFVRIESDGQTVTDTISADSTYTDSIKVTGASSSRIFTIDISGTWTTTVSLQRSTAADTGPFTEVATYTSNQTLTYDDGLDNQIAWYRIGFDTGWDTGSATLTLTYTLGSITGIAKIRSVTSSTAAAIDTFQNMGGTDAYKNWYFHDWSRRSGRPTSVAFTDGRLGWFGRNKSWISVSDGYDSFDDATEGDSGPIVRTIGSGPVDTVSWAMDLNRLVLGTDGREFEIRGSKDDEPITPSNAALKAFGTQGSAKVIAVKMDKTGIYTQRGGARLREIGLSESWEFQTSDLTAFNPEIGKPGITHIALQRQPDNRLHCVRSDGTVAMLLHDPAENVSCWVEHELGNESTLTTYTNTTSVTDSNIDGQRTAINISPDGTKAFIGYTTDNLVREYTLSTAYDLDSRVDTGNSFSFSLNAAFAGGSMVAMYTNPAGTRVFAVDTSGFEGVVQFDLSTGWDASTASDSGNTHDLSGDMPGGNPRGLWFASDGESFCVADGATEDIYRYTVTSAWELTGVAKASDSLNTGSSPTDIRGLSFNADGTELFICGLSDTDIYVYSMPTAFNLDGGVLRKTIDISADTTAPENIWLDGTRFYLSDYNTPPVDFIREYTEGTATVSSEVEDIVILPGADGSGEDAVYYAVKHAVNNTTVRFLEKWSLESECQGGTLSKNLDAHVVGTVTNGIMTGLSHLEAETVGVWVNGVDAGTYTVSGGQITGVTSDGSAVAGLAYKAQFKSAKLGALLTKQLIARLGVILDKTHYQGLRYGPDFDNLDELPLVEDGYVQDSDTIHDQYDEEPFTFDGTWDTNSRLCLEAESPRPCTLLAAIIETEE